MKMEDYPDYLRELMTELSPSEFLNIALTKLDEMDIRSREDVFLLDKLLMKVANMSKNIKMKMMSSAMKEKFNKVLDDMELDKKDFLNLEMYQGVKGPYTTENINSKFKSAEEKNFEVSRSRDITGSRSAQGSFQEQTQKMYKVSSAASSPVISKSAVRSYRSHGGHEMPRPRSSSSSGSSSRSGDNERDTLRRKLKKPQDACGKSRSERGDSGKAGKGKSDSIQQIYKFKEQLEKQGAYPMQKSSFSSTIIKPESSSRESEEAYGSPYATNKADVSSSGRIVRSHGFSRSGDQGDSTPGRSVRSYDTHSERDDAYVSSRSDAAYRSRYSSFEDDSPNRSDSNFARNQGRWSDKKAYPRQFSSCKY